MPSIYKMTKLTVRSHDVLQAAINVSHPKTEDDYYHAAECRTALKDLVSDRKIIREGDSVGVEVVLKAEENDLTLSESAFRFLERVFKEAREGGQVFRGAHAENVVEAIKIVKAASGGTNGACVL